MSLLNHSGGLFPGEIVPLWVCRFRLSYILCTFFLFPYDIWTRLSLTTKAAITWWVGHNSRYKTLLKSTLVCFYYYKMLLVFLNDRICVGLILFANSQRRPRWDKDSRSQPIFHIASSNVLLFLSFVSFDRVFLCFYFNLSMATSVWLLRLWGIWGKEENITLFLRAAMILK